MAVVDRVWRKLSARAQPYVSEPVIAAANFGWTVTWQTASSATNHPERAGDFPEAVLIAVSASQLWFLHMDLDRVSHPAPGTGQRDV